MSLDVSEGEAPTGGLFLKPTVAWPKQMTVGLKHLVEVDLALVTSDGAPADWPLEEEDCAYTCALEGGRDFDLWAVHDACVVLHRFGGSYGPAQFVVTPRHGSVDRSLRLTFVNPWGVPVAALKLPVSVPVPDDTEDPEDTRPRTPVAVDGTGTGESADDLAVWYAELTEAAAAPAEADLDADRLDAEPAGFAGSEPSDTLAPDVSYPELDDHEEPALAAQPGAGGPAAYTEPSAPGRDDGERRPAQLAERYNLIGLRRSPSGSLYWELIPLFSPGSLSGTRVTFTVHCAPSDEHGTVFAVIAESPYGSASQGRQLLSVQSAKIPSGIYRVTAELLSPFPGFVRFSGLPVTLRDDFRLWPEIAASVPSRLAPGTGPVHLMAAIETSAASDDLVARRISRVTQLFEYVAAEAEDLVCYSVISYGPHAIGIETPEFPEVPVSMLTWASSADVALDQLARLSRRPAAPLGYRRAAQLECVLTELEGRLTGQEGRPVLVTAGARPEHPPRVDADSQIIPCRWRNDWRVPIGKLRARFPGIAFGAIRDTELPNELWRILSTGSEFEDFSAADLASTLGLVGGSAQLIPLPMFSDMSTGAAGQS